MAKFCLAIRICQKLYINSRHSTRADLWLFLLHRKRRDDYKFFLKYQYLKINLQHKYGCNILIKLQISLLWNSLYIKTVIVLKTCIRLVPARWHFSRVVSEHVIKKLLYRVVKTGPQHHFILCDANTQNVNQWFSLI